MEPEYLTKEVFEVWAHSFNEKLTEACNIRAEVETTKANVAVLKDRSDRAERKSYATMVVSMVLGGLGGLFAGHR